MDKLLIDANRHFEKKYSRYKRIGIHGTPGSFSEEAAQSILQKLNIPREHLAFEYCTSVKGVLDFASTDNKNLGLFATHNAGSGDCVFTFDAILECPTALLQLVNFRLLINQCLIAHPSITSVDEIKEIFAHPQAYLQCKKTLQKEYAEISVRVGTDNDDTALNVKRIARGELPKTTATLASKAAASLYHATILKERMQHIKENLTSFAIVAKS